MVFHNYGCEKKMKKTKRYKKNKTRIKHDKRIRRKTLDTSVSFYGTGPGLANAWKSPPSLSFPSKSRPNGGESEIMWCMALSLVSTGNSSESLKQSHNPPKHRWNWAKGERDAACSNSQLSIWMKINSFLLLHKSLRGNVDVSIFILTISLHCLFHPILVSLRNNYHARLTGE